MTCSTVHNDSIPAFSAAVARPTAPSAVPNGPMLANAIPTFMALPGVVAADWPSLTGGPDRGPIRLDFASEWLDEADAA